MRFVTRVSLALAIVIAWAVAVRADEPGSDVPNNLILERFPISKRGDALVVPVRIDEKEHLFLLDTGSNMTVFDPSLPLGEPRGKVQASTPAGPAEVTLHDPPEASIGKIPLRGLPTVLAMDMSGFRASTGYPIDGLLGMDFLRTKVVRVDLDRGELLFLKSPPRGSGESVPLTLRRAGCPKVTASIGKQKILFTIDIGYVGTSGVLDAVNAQKLEASGGVRPEGSGVATTAAGMAAAPIVRVDRLELGKLAVDQSLFVKGAAGAECRLGLAFWSRFLVTFDFPRGRVLLRKNSSFDRPDRGNPSGLALLKQGEAVVVIRVEPGSPGDRAGVRPGDLLIRAGMLPAKETHLYQLRDALSGTGPLDCVFTRRGEELPRTIKLPEEAAGSPTSSSPP